MKDRFFTPAFATIYFGVIVAMLLFFSKNGIPLALLYPFSILPFLPALFVSKQWFLPALICTMSVFSNMPGGYFYCNWLFYLALIVIVAIYYAIRERQMISPLEFLPFALLGAYMSAIDYWSGDDITDNHTYILGVMALLTLGCQRVPSTSSGQTLSTSPLGSAACLKQERDDVAGVWGGTYAFVIASLLISIVYFINFDNYAEEYGFKTDVMRAYYTDPNYQGCTIGMGIIMAIYLLLSRKAYKMWQRVLCLACVLVSLLAMFALASRGALIAVVIACTAFILFSKTRTSIKVFIVLAGIAMVAYAYSNHYMDLFMFRMQEDSLATGTRRTIIWASKIDAFTRDDNLLHWLFGMGRFASLELGEYKQAAGITGFHNQYLAHLVNYGIAGLTAFIAFLLLPIVKASKENKMVVSIMILYLAVVCITLEPFTNAFPAFYLFYFYIYILATRETHPTT